MKCFYHPEVEGAAFCRQCGKALCGDCRRDVKGVPYCEDCLAATVMPPAGPPAAALPPGAPNPGVALALGFIPGVGAIYNGDYAKAFIYLVIFGGLISLASAAPSPFEPLIGFLIFGFYIFMPIEAYQTAKRRAAGLEPAPSGWQDFGLAGSERATPIGPLILIVLGALFLLGQLDLFHWTWHIWRFWPVILIAIGAWLLWQRTARPAPPTAGPPSGPPSGTSPAQGSEKHE